MDYKLPVIQKLFSWNDEKGAYLMLMDNQRLNNSAIRI
jgi:hypothetical protein